MTITRNRIQLQTEYVKCRTWGHTWESFQPLHRRQGYGIVVSLRCDRCSTERHDTIDANGDLNGRQYIYPNDYATAADDRPTMTDLRIEIIHRLRQNRARLRVVKA